MTYEAFKIAIIEMAIKYGDFVFDVHYSDVQRAIIKALSKHDGEKSSEDYIRLAYNEYCRTHGITE